MDYEAKKKEMTTEFNKNQQTMKTPSTGENLSTKNFSSSFE
jgi:hypothetical protein